MGKKIAVIFATLVFLFLIYKLTSQIMETAKSGERVSKALDEVFKLEVKNKNLKKEVERISKTEFIEEEIRNKLGFSKAGETIIIIPEERLKQVLGASSPAQIRLPNPLGWLKVFFR